MTVSRTQRLVPGVQHGLPRWCFLATHRRCAELKPWFWQRAIGPHPILEHLSRLLPAQVQYGHILGGGDTNRHARAARGARAVFAGYSTVRRPAHEKFRRLIETSSQDLVDVAPVQFLRTR